MSSDEITVSESAHNSEVPLINESECQTNEQNYAKDDQNSTNYKSDESKENKFESNSLLLGIPAPPRRKLNRGGSLRRTHNSATTDEPLIESNQISIVESSPQIDSNSSQTVLTNQSSKDNQLLPTFIPRDEPQLKDTSIQCNASDLFNKEIGKSCRRSTLPKYDGLKTLRSHSMDRIRRWNTQWFTSNEAKANRRRRVNRCIYYLKVFLTHLFSTTGLCLLVIAYSCMGAFIFKFLESKHEVKEKFSMFNQTLYNETIYNEIIKCANHLWNNTITLNVIYPEKWNKTTIERLEEFTNIIMKAIRDKNSQSDKGPGSPSDQQWTFSGALLYSVTVITTIGYGNVTCKTSWGRIVTMIYALFGIPVMFLCLANLGNLMAETFRFSYKRIGWICFCCSDRLSNKYNEKHNNKSSLKSQNEKIELKNCAENEKEVKVIFSENDEQKVRSIIALTPSTPPTTSEISSQASSPTKNELNQQNSDLVVIHKTQVKGVKIVESNDDRVPVWLVILLVIGYIMGGAVMFSVWEDDWGLLEGAYFCFTTLTTIGFGDLVPGSAKYSDDKEGQTKFIICCAYLIVGLSLLAMSFNLVQEEIVIKSKALGRRMGIIPDSDCDQSVSV